jgi:hypothetical protein
MESFNKAKGEEDYEKEIGNETNDYLRNGF